MMSTNHNKKQRRLAAEEADVNDDKYDQDGPDEDMLGVSTSKRQRNRQRTDGGNNDNKKGIVAASRIDNGSKANNNLPATATRTANPSGLTPQQQRQQHAKDRLSKFAARLFDASRPKGLVDTPEIIPLNDTFLADFGKREREFDQAKGVEFNINHEIDSGDDADDDNNDGDNGNNTDIDGVDDKSNQRKKRKGETSELDYPIPPEPKKSKATQQQNGYKVKIANLAYRTTEDTLTKACIRFGTISEVNLLLDSDMVSTNNGNQTIHNSGLAFVTFDTEDGAQSCIDGFKTLDGRSLRVSLATTRPKHSIGGGGGASASAIVFAHSASLLSIGLNTNKDISTICFRCGQVGHREADCTNPAKPKPCTLCGTTDHDQRGCPNNKICFNCGCPGHVSRDCQFPRNSLPRRMVCGSCFQSGHHRMQCRMQSQYDIPRQTVDDAICMVCGKVGGGFMCCKSLKWFFGLKGLSCFNCGMQGHSGYDCQRPSLYQCMQDPELTIEEIERAEQTSIAEELEKQREARDQSNRNRSHSLPPSRNAGGQQNDRHYHLSSSGGVGNDTSRRHSSSGEGANRGQRGGNGNNEGNRRRDRRGY